MARASAVNLSVFVLFLFKEHHKLALTRTEKKDWETPVYNWAGGQIPECVQFKTKTPHRSLAGSGTK